MTALFLGTALSISSIKIVAMVVREMNFMRRDLGQVIMASAIIEDSIGWIVIADHLQPGDPGNDRRGLADAQRRRHGDLPPREPDRSDARGACPHPLGE